MKLRQSDSILSFELDSTQRGYVVTWEEGDNGLRDKGDKRWYPADLVDTLIAAVSHRRVYKPNGDVVHVTDCKIDFDIARLIDEDNNELREYLAENGKKVTASG